MSKVTSEINVSDYLIRLTKELVKDQGIIPELVKRYKTCISDQIILKSCSIL